MKHKHKHQHISCILLLSIASCSSIVNALPWQSDASDDISGRPPHSIVVNNGSTQGLRGSIIDQSSTNEKERQAQFAATMFKSLDKDNNSSSEEDEDSIIEWMKNDKQSEHDMIEYFGYKVGQHNDMAISIDGGGSIEKEEDIGDTYSEEGAYIMTKRRLDDTVDSNKHLPWVEDSEESIDEHEQHPYDIIKQERRLDSSHKTIPWMKDEEESDNTHLEVVNDDVNVFWTEETNEEELLPVLEEGADMMEVINDSSSDEDDSATSIISKGPSKGAHVTWDMDPQNNSGDTAADNIMEVINGDQEYNEEGAYIKIQRQLKAQQEEHLPWVEDTEESSEEEGGVIVNDDLMEFFNEEYKEEKVIQQISDGVILDERRLESDNNDKELPWVEDEVEEEELLPVLEDEANMIEMIEEKEPPSDILAIESSERRRLDEDNTDIISKENRRLEDANGDDYAEAEVNDDMVNDDGQTWPNYDEWYAHIDADDDAWYQIENTDDATVRNNSITSYLQNKVVQAESSAWTFYANPPSEWTSTQWDLVFALSISTFAICCIFSVLCAYNCMKDDDLDTLGDKDWAPKHPSAKLTRKIAEDKGKGSWKINDMGHKCWAPKRDNMLDKLRQSRWNSRKNKRRVFDEEHYRQYQEEVEEEVITDTADYGVANSESITLNTNSSIGASYEPPDEQATTQPDSLVDYTSVQREKEARILEALKAADLRQHEANKQQVLVEGVEGNVVDQTIDQTYSDNSDWSGLWTYRGTNKVKKSEVDKIQELREESAKPKEDKLMEARALKHNFVGYYVED